MKFIVACLLSSVCLLSAAEKPKKKSFPGQIYAPDLVLHFREQLGLTDEQLKFIRDETDRAKTEAQEHQEGVALETRKLQRLIEKSITGEDEALEQMQRLIDHDAKLKLIQWRMIVRVKNQLDARQRSKLAELAANFDPKQVGPSQAQRKRLEDKIAKVKKGMRELADLGVSPEEISKMLEGLNPLFREQKYDAAEALIDRAIKKLDDPF